MNTTSSLSAEMKTFYERQLLERAVALFVHGMFGQVKPIPKNAGKTIEFRKYGAFAPATTPLVQGVTPVGNTIAVTTVTATLNPYGDYVEGTDELLMTAFDPLLSETAVAQGEQAGETFDLVVRDILNAGTSVQYAGGQLSRGAITTNDKFSSTELRKGIRTLEKNKARKRNGSWAAIVSPDTKFDIQGDSKWEAANENVPTLNQMEGRIGRWYGTDFYESPNSKVFEDAGSGGIDVHSTLLLGANAYGIVPLEGAMLEFIVQALGSGGTSDPLGQRWTAGWKSMFTAVILQQLFMLRIEHAVST